MCVIRWFLLKSCIFGMYISVTEASVTLRTFDREETYLKDTPVTLVCTITPYNNEMTWYVDNDPYADCFLGTCGPSPNKPYTFTFDFDETAGVFNLTINSVNFAHAKLSFACDDGNVRETISFNVTTVANEGNGDNDDRTLGGGAIAGIVVAIVFAIAVIIVVYLRPKLTMFEQHERTLEFKWTDCLNCCCQWIFEYNLVCTKVPWPNDRAVNFCREESTKEKFCDLKEIDQMAIYEINLSRKLCCCCKRFAKKRYVMTLNAECVVGSTTIFVSWTIPTRFDFWFIVTCNDQVVMESDIRASYMISNLNPDKKYRVEVVAIFNYTKYILYANDVKTYKQI